MEAIIAILMVVSATLLNPMTKPCTRIPDGRKRGPAKLINKQTHLEQTHTSEFPMVVRAGLLNPEVNT